MVNIRKQLFAFLGFEGDNLPSFPCLSTFVRTYYILDIVGTVYIILWGRDSAVDIATRYGLDGPGIESPWGRDFPPPSRPALGPTQPPIQWVPGLSWE